MNKRIVEDYLESLKEDKELDYIFPILLKAMDFRIVSTPKNSKGQSQYGKDVVAIGKSEDGKLYRWFFELKGNAAQHINDSTFSAKDGVRESIIASKDTAYEDSSIPLFNQLPIKVVFVHNGILFENTRPTFDGFIKREFPDGNFERWGIEKLTELFTKHLFDECLFCDEVSYRSFKKVLIMIDTPGWNEQSLDLLINIQLKSCEKENKCGRLTKKSFAALSLLLAIIYKYAKESNALIHAKKASCRIVLKTWAWIIHNKKDKNSKILNLFSKIVELHLQIFEDYVKKILPNAGIYKGLYWHQGVETEMVCYPLRCYDFLNDLLYYFIAIDIFFEDKKSYDEFRKESLDIISEIIQNNSGYELPLLDIHSNTLRLLLYYIFSKENHNFDVKIIGKFIYKLTINVVLRHKKRGMFPELHSNRRHVAESLYEKTPDYEDRSSLFLLVLFEIIVWLGLDQLYLNLYDEVIKSGVNLQISYPIDSDVLEENLFSHQLYNELSVETSIKIPQELKDFKSLYKKRYNHIYLRTEDSPFKYLIILAHIYYETDLFPDFADLGFCEPLS